MTGGISTTTSFGKFFKMRAAFLLGGRQWRPPFAKTRKG
jgi:hypothetical protein